MPEYDAMKIALDMAHAETRDALARVAEARAAETPVKMRPCPFCGSEKVDAEGWCSTTDNVVFKHGPACDECGGSAEDIYRWNTRPLEDGGTYLEISPDVIELVEEALNTAWMHFKDKNDPREKQMNEALTELADAVNDAGAVEP